MNIRELTLFTGHLEQQLEFYNKVLEIPVIYQSLQSVAFQVGKSVLKLNYKERAGTYHFAFNIPSYKGADALNWLHQRVAVLGFDGKDIVDFSDWNAESVYFYDADKNIVEFIARKNLGIIEATPFSSKQLINISEIGVATNNIERTYRQLNSLQSLSIYDGNFDRFCAAGDEHGLFILADRNKKQWFPTGDTIHLSDFILRGDYNIEYKDGEVVMIKE